MLKILMNLLPKIAFAITRPLMHAFMQFVHIYTQHNTIVYLFCLLKLQLAYISMYLKYQQGHKNFPNILSNPFRT